MSEAAAAYLQPDETVQAVITASNDQWKFVRGKYLGERLRNRILVATNPHTLVSHAPPPAPGADARRSRCPATRYPAPVSWVRPFRCDGGPVPAVPQETLRAGASPNVAVRWTVRCSSRRGTLATLSGPAPRACRRSEVSSRGHATAGAAGPPGGENEQRDAAGAGRISPGAADPNGLAGSLPGGAPSNPPVAPPRPGTGPT